MSNYCEKVTIVNSSGHLNCRAKEKRRLELLQQKTSFTPGLWNINTVAIGGLGKDPEEATNEGIGIKAKLRAIIFYCRRCCWRGSFSDSSEY